VRLEWERQTTESARAFAAFCAYRDLGPSRSIDRAYTVTRERHQPGRAAGQWNAWSVEHRWVERAAAYDGHLDAQRRRIREARLRELEERRLEFELRNQVQLERRADRMDELADKAEQAPVVDVVQKLGNGTIVKVKGLNLSAYARLVHERNEAARQAVVGVRAEEKPEKPDEKVSAGGHLPKGEFVWVPPTPEPESSSDGK
jgi:hypothetical protein